MFKKYKNSKKNSSEKKFLKMISSTVKNQNDYLYGPLPLKESEENLNLIIENILNPERNASFSYNELNELIVHWDGSEAYNITSILKDEPRFDHIELSQLMLENYQAYIEDFFSQHPNMPPKLKNEYYTFKEIKAGVDPSLLHLGEKIAIHLYTDSYYVQLNYFLRNFAIKNIDSPISIQNNEKIILSTILVVSSGLAKLNLQKNMQDAYRIENDKLPEEEIVRRKNHFLGNTLLVERGFFSSSNFSEKSIFLMDKNTYAKTYSLIIDNKEAKPVLPYSAYPQEKELLFMPGTKFSVLNYGTHDQKNYFVLKAIGRTLGLSENISEDKEENLSLNSNAL